MFVCLWCHYPRHKEFQDDKGGEYISKEWDDWMKEHGIKRRHTVKGTPQQNGVLERLNRTLAEGVIAMINHAGLPVTSGNTDFSPQYPGLTQDTLRASQGIPGHPRARRASGRA